MIKSEKASPVEDENVLLRLIREGAEIQRARARQVFDFLKLQPVYPKNAGLSNEQALENSVRWEIESEMWSDALKKLIAENLDQYSIWQFVQIAARANVSEAIAYGQRIQADKAAEELRAKKKAAAEAGHSKPGRSRDKRNKIQAIWETGIYKTKIACVKGEHERLGMSFSTAYDALKSPKKPEST